MIATHVHEVSTTGQGDAHDVTAAVAHAVAESGLRAGIVTVFVVGSTAGVTTIEFEPGALHDVNAVFEALAPRAGEYQHHLADFVLEFDTRPRRRELVVQIVGD